MVGTEVIIMAGNIKRYPEWRRLTDWKSNTSTRLARKKHHLRPLWNQPTDQGGQCPAAGAEIIDQKDDAGDQEYGSHHCRSNGNDKYRIKQPLNLFCDEEAEYVAITDKIKVKSKKCRTLLTGKKETPTLLNRLQNWWRIWRNCVPKSLLCFSGCTSRRLLLLTVSARKFALWRTVWKVGSQRSQVGRRAG